MYKLVIGCWLLVIGCFCDASAQTQKVENKDKSFTLIKTDTTNASGIPVLKYKVMRNGDKKIILEGSITMGVIEWSADYELEESRWLGSQAPPGGGSKRKIDVRVFLN
jgi:hypothetical protein